MTRDQVRRALIVLVVCGAFGLVVFTRVPSCPLAAVFGVPCPGCGLTRATLALVHGRLGEALHLHPLVLILLPVFGWAVSAAALGYVRGPQRDARPRLWLSSRTVSLLAATLLVATVGVWGARFWGCFGGPVPVTTFWDWSRSKGPPLSKTPFY